MQQIDYSCTQLSDDEMAELFERNRQEDERDKTKEELRWAKARHFRFSGGMC